MELSAALSIVDNITTIITNKVGRDDLKLLITEDGAWNAFETKAELSSTEGAALRDALEKHLDQEPVDENDEREKRQQKENFLKEFPELKRKLEEHIRKIRALADHLDQVHWGCTISNVVSGSTGITATITGLVLPPFTAGASLLIPAGLGAAAAATGVTTTIVEESIRMADESEARHLIGASMDILDRILKITPLITFKVSSKGVELFCAWKTLRDHIEAIRTGRTGNFITFGEGIRQLKNLIISHDIPLVTRVARIAKGVGHVTIFGFDVYNLVTDSIDLYNGAKTQSAEALRELANNLEEKLCEFEQLHKAL